MSSGTSDIIDQAIAWHMRQDGMDGGDWAAFVDWLESDAEHALAYDRVAMQDRLIPDVAFPQPREAANDDHPRSPRWWHIAGGTAIAAALALWVVPIATHPRDARTTIATRDGERRAIRFADGTQVAMNGGTTLRFDPGDTRNVTLDRGEVTLHVVHDSANPFTLRAGDHVIRDLGTVFNVVSSGDGLSVEVGEGAVSFQPGAEDVHLAAGDALTVRGNGSAATIVRSKVVPTAVGGWRNDTLSFAGSPISEVVASLKRAQGTDVRVAGALSQRPFTGMIHLTGTADRDVPHLADLIGATWRRDGRTWILEERSLTAR